MTRLLTATAAGAFALGGTSLAQTERQADSAPPLFVSCGTLLDADVASPADREHTADVDDLVVDMRDGRIAYAIIDTNGILGSDNKVVAVPYAALTWRATDQNFAIDATAAQLGNLPPCDPKNLVKLSDPTWFSTLRGIFGDRHELNETARERGDEYTWHFSHARPESIDGTIVAINRQAKTAQGATCYAVVVAEKDSAKQRTIFLAPASYFAGQSHVPSEGDVVTVTGVKALDHEGRVIGVAQTIRVDGETMRLRDRNGVPAWMSDDARPARSFYKLASDLDNGSLYAQGESFGKVDDVVFEAHSGTAAFAVISVGGLLGVNDMLYPIPCGTFTPGRDHDLFINMPIAKLKVAPKLSEDGLQDLNNEKFAMRVCDYFGVKSKTFDTGRSSRWSNHPTTP